MASLAAPVPVSLPPLRQELRIEPGTPLIGGAPGWTLFDPLRHAFYRLGRIEHAIFACWARGSFAELGDALAAEGLDDTDANRALQRVVAFSLEHQLVVTPMGDVVAAMQDRRAELRRAWWKWMLDNYLFFRVPLVRPAARLEAAMRWFKPLWSVKTLWFFVALVLFDLIMVARQWDVFATSFLYFFSWQGVLVYALGLSAVKVIHELGHALTATRFGCRVASMGVSFLVMMPVLYTDTTSAWRLRSRRQRIAIDCAGVAAELITAALCTFVWLWLPDGALRSAMFVLATSSWILSLFINLSPLTRFDGYYVLSDLLGVPNLQARSFAFGRWQMRELLFGLHHAPPEEMPPRLRLFLVGYAWLTWIYRIVLFLGIALLVYHFFFKLAGILLFTVEIGVFIVRPIVAELRAWIGLRGDVVRSSRGRWTLGLTGLALVALVLPLDRHVTAPAVLAPIESEPLVAGDAARIDAVRVTDGQLVRRGQIIAELSAPALRASQKGSEARIAGLETRLARSSADRVDLSNRSVIERELAAERARLQGAGEMAERLVLRAPIDGIVADLRAEIHVGRWVGGGEVVARIVSRDRADIQAYIGETGLARIEESARGRFVPDDVARSARSAKLLEIGRAAVQSLDQPLLASINGGPIAVNSDTQNHLKPREALYRLRFLAALERSNRSPAFIQPIPGRIIIDADRRSVLDDALRWLMRLVHREASIS
ncbi:site-2 protease family protein [Sphingomonas sp. UYEF23]|uniref:site-2 protease family protein n=1 Tax=Sphingomonas sp. UYEF23 TaxID=1756408 RepID=UPI00339A2199